MDERLQLLETWLREEQGMTSCRVTPASGDASFRRYFRVEDDGKTLIAMDAPPDREDCRPFIRIAGAMGGMGLNVPRVIAGDADKGFLLLTDLGHRQYLDELDTDSADALYGDAMQALLRLQKAPPDAALPSYDRALLMNEMALFRDWFVEQHLGITLSQREQEIMNLSFELLADAALEQPVVWVHRDYHSRNLMVVPDDNPGVLDFQDAVAGPVTYDLVSLLRDCYISWPEEKVRAWVRDYYAGAVSAGIIDGVDEARFQRWFDLMGVQRHLKATGIFARLNIRDGKPGYLNDIPRTLAYILQVCEREPALRDFCHLVSEKVVPLMPAA